MLVLFSYHLWIEDKNQNLDALGPTIKDYFKEMIMGLTKQMIADEETNKFLRILQMKKVEQILKKQRQNKTKTFQCNQVFKNLQVEAPELQANPQKMEIPVQETNFYKRETRHSTQQARVFNQSVYSSMKEKDQVRQPVDIVVGKGDSEVRIERSGV